MKHHITVAGFFITSDNLPGFTSWLSSLQKAGHVLERIHVYETPQTPALPPYMEVVTSSLREAKAHARQKFDFCVEGADFVYFALSSTGPSSQILAWLLESKGHKVFLLDPDKIILPQGGGEWLE